MKCPYCSFEESKVVDSRHSEDGTSIRRRRECLQCGKRFTTYETVESLPIVVVKKDGRRQTFDRSKVLNGMVRACEKRPVSIASLEAAATEIEQIVHNSLEREVRSDYIGELVMERLKPLLCPLLVELLRAEGQEIRGLYERNDVAIRALEGLEQGKGWFPLPGLPTPESPVTEICENGIYYAVDVENGQKTGFFLDQKYNRLAVARLARGRRVLDCFTHTGSFALNAAKGGAEHVTAVDVSASAIEMARRNAVRNGLEGKMDFVVADVFELLPELIEKGGRPYDFIILDPPAFTKSRKTVDAAQRGYKELNLRALRLLPRGGYFATASCSHFMPDELFVKMLRAAALDAGVELRQIEARQQAPDHPILWNVPETDYLKFYLFQVV